MRKSLLLLVAVCLSYSALFAQLLAFPGAEGFGKYAKGARVSATPTVYHVTNLNDAGTGSFRDAVSASNRIIVFDVAGVIKLTSGGIVVSANNYIAGQTAPGEGITVYGDRITFSSASNTICRYVRFRMGVIGTSGKDAMGIANGQDMIFDHISASWGRDETFSINWDSKGTEPTNITIQNSIIAQGLLLHSAGGLIQTNGGVTLFRNLYCDNSTRNNKVKGITEYVNNIVYNWDNAAYIMGGDSEGSSYVNVFSNYFIQGPNKGGTPISNGNADYHIYGEDNWFDNTLDGTLNGYLIPHSEYSGGPDFQAAPYSYPVLPAIPASTLVNDLLPTVGASLPYRDYVDYYVVNEVKSFGFKGELLSTESTLPFGAPSTWSLWAGTTRVDTDKDGIPDAWETAKGLDPNLATDAVIIAANGYTNIENYINSLTTNSSQPYLRTPLLFGVKSSTQNSITFKWLDYTRDETGFVIERNINKVWTPIATIPAETDSFRLEGLVPEEKDTFRIKAIGSSLSSDYSTQLIAKSKPIEVPVLNLATFTPDLTWNGAANSDWDKVSANWNNGSSSVAFTDSTKVMLSPTSSKTINITDQIGVKALVIQSDSNIVLNGAGKLAGQGSVNKTGSGSLSLLTSNTYTGATVVHDGTLTINTLANGGIASSIGSSANYAFNFVLKGGKVDYTGATVATDRNILLDKTSEFSVSNSAATVTMNGTLTGTGGFIKSGSGVLKVFNNKGNTYEGETSIAGGTLNLDMQTSLNVADVLGSSNVVNLIGGTLQTTNGQTANYEVYNFDLVIPEGKTGGFAPFRNCYIKSKVKGSGTLNFTIPYLREYIQGNWTEFTGILNANGTNTTASGGSQLLLDNGVGIPYARINLTGNTKIIYWTTTGTLRLGGLSGVAGTFLGSASKQTDGTSMTWIVGGAGTDETFNGIINNDCSASGHYGVTYIEKEGTGYWRLNGANVYTGTTTLRGGTLIVNGTQTGIGKVTVMQDATLTGKGKIPGVTEVQSGGIISAGDAYATPITVNIGTLTVGALTLQAGSRSDLEINRTSSLFDKVVSTGTITFGGTLNLKIVGALVAGDQFQLFTGTSYSGAFSDIIPATPGDGLKWTFTNGVLKVDPVNGIESVQNSKVKVYPNPVSDRAEISLDKVYDYVSINVESLSGSLIKSNSFSGLSQMNLDLSTLPKGFYIIRIKGDNELNSSSKIMKK
jgi:autotransporter-associated beta strand protein